MVKRLLMTTALSGLMLSAAVAQSPPPADPPKAAPPAASQKQDMNKAATPAKPQDVSKPAAASADKTVIASQQPDHWLASKFSGTDVVGADNKKVGDVTDILFDRDGKIHAYVVSIGGFLGIGSKSVAMAPSAFQVEKGSNGAADRLKISMSQEELKQMPSFAAYQPPRPRPTTTGSAPGGGLGRPAPTGGANR
jgi:sporulation protein YlmC with PRC-barrel domain